MLVIFLSTFGTVGAGERGIKTRFSAVTGEVLGEGLYFKLPFVEKVVKVDVKTQKEEVQASGASKDLQTVNATIALNYNIEPTSVARLYQTVGLDYANRIISPAIQESVKATTAKFTAEELITKREQVRDEVKNLLTARLAVNGLRVEQFSIVNFDFSKSFNEAIEAKVTAEQNALAAKNKLAQVEYEAKQRVEQAKGEAEAIRIQSEAITKQGGKEYVALKWVEKWNGAMPVTVLSENATPIINLK